MDKLETKQDFQHLLLRLVCPLKPFFNEGGALPNLGGTSAHYPDRVAMLESFARPLWGLAPFWMGGGEEPNFEKLYHVGFAAGANPNSPAYWDADGEVNQRYVEMAAIALGLLLTPEKLWHPLAQSEKDNLAVWLGKINTIDLSAYPDCNWWFFVVLVNLALQRLGLAHSPQTVEHAFGQLESFYLGGGWYKDGAGARRDYYVPFAIHFYSLLYCALVEKEDPERCKKFRRRAEAFAQDFLYWFDDSGRALPYGRSLAYRFAQAAFWSAYVFTGLNTVPLPVVKGILSRHLQQWLRHPIADRNGVLTIGYHYPNLNMAENYNAPGSPYWALKVFLLLALPDNHPFWLVKPQAMPALEPLRHFPAAGMLIQRAKGYVALYPSGVFRNDSFGHMPEKYGKFVYSTEFGFSVAVGNDAIELAAPDNMLAFELDGYIFTRRSARCTQVLPDRLVTEWSPIQGIKVETTLIPTPKGHLRQHRIQNQLGGCTAYDCGFTIEAKAPNAYSSKAHKGAACTQNSRAITTARCHAGIGQGIVIVPAPNTNLLYSKTAMAAVRYHIPNGTTYLETEFEAELKSDE